MSPHPRPTVLSRSLECPKVRADIDADRARRFQHGGGLRFIGPACLIQHREHRAIEEPAARPIHVPVTGPRLLRHVIALRLLSGDNLRIGERIARPGLPTLFLMEGGYAVEEIGIDVVNVLAGYQV